LKKIGRLHDSKEALEAIERAKLHGFENINADVMFNIPGQTVKDIEDTVMQIVERNVKHISFYSLKLEQGTPMYVMEKNHKIVMPEEDVDREMYYAGRRIMEENDIMQYEISNFAKKGYECKHNLKYWMQEEYIGFGPSAHSFLNKKRFSNPSDINSYCDGAEHNIFNRNIEEILDDKAEIFEYIMLCLRLTKGLNINEFKQKFSVDFNKTYQKQIDYLMKNNLLEYKERGHTSKYGEPLGIILEECPQIYIKLTNRGMDISNFVFEKFM